MKPLDHALAIAAEGFSCFPVHANKVPACARGHLAATRDPDALRLLWAGCKAPLVGVATGAVTGASVLDIDRQHGGLDWWQKHRHHLPVTRTHRTRSGGLHL